MRLLKTLFNPLLSYACHCHLLSVANHSCRSSLAFCTRSGKINGGRGRREYSNVPRTHLDGLLGSCPFFSNTSMFPLLRNPRHATIFQIFWSRLSHLASLRAMLCLVQLYSALTVVAFVFRQPPQAESAVPPRSLTNQEQPTSPEAANGPRRPTPTHSNGNRAPVQLDENSGWMIPLTQFNINER